MIKVGVTGGIGSGKTTVCRIFESMGIPVYYSDKEAKELMYRNQKLKSSIKQLLGKESYFRNGRPNRQIIASKIFSDKELLKGINNLVHPAVRNDHLSWHKKQQAPYTINEAALLVENGSYKQLDALIVVTAPMDIRVHRVMQRDGTSQEKVEARMRNQLPESEKVAVADYVIDNAGDTPLIQQVWEIRKQNTTTTPQIFIIL